LDDAQSDSLNLHITAREEWNEESYTLEWNISKQVRGFMLGFGNGVWVEIRIVAETQYAVEIVRGLLMAGGYRPVSQPAPRTTLFQEGDECWEGIVFLAPVSRQVPPLKSLKTD